jgi:hypothetical protein
MKILPVNTPSLLNLSAAMNNIKSTPSVSFTSNPQERRLAPFPPSTSAVPTPTQLQSQPAQINEPPIVYFTRPHTGDVGPVADSWRVRQGLVSNSPSQVNQTNNVSSFGGPVQPSLRSGPPRERNEYVSDVGDEGYESWSPENRRYESQEYMPGRNHSGPRSRMNSGWDYMPNNNNNNNRSRQRNSSGHGDRNWNGNRRWH